jgi:hypothetical protein
MSLRSDLAPERSIDRQRAAAVDKNREADQQEIKRDLHATAGPEPADLEVDMKGGDRHEAAKQRGNRPGEQPDRQQNSAEEFEVADVGGSKHRRFEALLREAFSRPN